MNNRKLSRDTIEQAAFGVAIGAIPLVFCAVLDCATQWRWGLREIDGVNFFVLALVNAIALAASVGGVIWVRTHHAMSHAE